MGHYMQLGHGPFQLAQGADWHRTTKRSVDLDRVAYPSRPFSGDSFCGNKGGPVAEQSHSRVRNRAEPTISLPSPYHPTRSSMAAHIDPPWQKPR
eukprot:scaffold1440_cov377-Prasinococcus_capsulatus_cf.AAC.2